MDTLEIIMTLKNERDRINQAIQTLEGSTSRGGKNGRLARDHGPSNNRRGRRIMSAAARRRISQAQKRRWAKQKKG